MSRRVALQVAVWILTLVCVGMMFTAPVRQLVAYLVSAPDGLP